MLQPKYALIYHAVIQILKCLVRSIRRKPLSHTRLLWWYEWGSLGGPPPARTGAALLRQAGDDEQQARECEGLQQCEGHTAGDGEEGGKGGRGQRSVFWQLQAWDRKVVDIQYTTTTTTKRL